MKTDIRSVSFKPAASRHSLGFTLVELMITVTIAAILLAVGVPSFRSFVLNQRVKSASSQIFHALTLARSEAIKRNAEVRLVMIDSNWQAGWTVSTVAGAVTLGTQGAFSDVSIIGPVDNITYSGTGRLTGSTTPSFSVTGGTTARCVTVNLSGLPSTKTGSC